MYQAPLSFTVSWSLLRLMSIELVMPSNYLILCLRFYFCLQSFPVSGSFQRICSSYQVVKVLELQLHHQSFQRKFVLISFRINWFDLLAVQRTLNNLLQNHSFTASVLQRSASFVVQLSHWYMTTGKTIGLITWTLSVK